MQRPDTGSSRLDVYLDHIVARLEALEASLAEALEAPTGGIEYGGAYMVPPGPGDVLSDDISD